MSPQWEEHLRDSAPCSSRFDGWDRGDRYPVLPAAAYGDEDDDIEFHERPIGQEGA